MKPLFRVLALCVIPLVVLSCSKKPVGSGSSTITLRMPNTNGGQSKSGVSTLSIPTDRKACFGVNVLAADIKGSPASSCSPATGLVGGFVESGGTLSLEVPKGENRTIELYMYLLPTGSTAPCPVMAKRFAAAQLSNLYYMGVAKNVALTLPETNVTISATFPGVAQTLATQNAYPASCSVAESQSRPGFTISTGSQVSTGGTIRMSGHIGTSGQTMSGGGMRMKAK